MHDAVQGQQKKKLQGTFAKKGQGRRENNAKCQAGLDGKVEPGLKGVDGAGGQGYPLAYPGNVRYYGTDQNPWDR